MSLCTPVAEGDVPKSLATDGETEETEEPVHDKEDHPSCPDESEVEIPSGTDS